jgi:ribosomal protein S27AE
MGRFKKVKSGGDAVVWRLRSCPKCGGDIFVDRDVNGWYEQCLQCGYVHDLATMVEVKEQVKEQPREKKRELAFAGHHKKSIAKLVL